MWLEGMLVIECETFKTIEMYDSNGVVPDFCPAKFYLWMLSNTALNMREGER